MRRKADSITNEHGGSYAYIARAVESVPPPPELRDARERVVERLRRARRDSGDARSFTEDEPDSAITDLRALERQQRHTDVSAIALRFDLEHEKRIAAEGALKSRDERLWTIVTGVVVLLAAAAILWAVATLVRADHAPPTSATAKVIPP